jgi:glutamyl-tRNA synthetase
MQKIRTRFAPSPTGYIHIGNLRAAIPPYLIARQNHGEFLLRVEDTDQARFVEGATDLILNTLKTLGLDWDGDPIYQTARKDIYYKYAQKLIEQGRAYADPTPPEKIAEYREAANSAKKPFLYRNFRPETPPQWSPGLPLRLKSDPKTRNYHDAILGDLTAGPETQDDIILIKADGLPTYNFAHIVDDAEMEITHVMRGVEYLPSMGNYLALYEALSLEPPIFAHMPHILAPTGNKKLGKRDGAKSANDYFADGILPEALLNFLIELGWNDGTNEEIYSKADLIRVFRLEDMQRSPARFDADKLLWLNGQWLRKLYAENPEALYRRTVNFWPETAKSYSDSEKYTIFSILYDRLKTLADLREMTTYFFVDPEIDLNLITNNKFLKKFSEKDLINLLETSATALEAVETWNPEKIQAVLNELLALTQTKPAELFSLLRIALTFAPFSPALGNTMAVLTKNTTLARLHAVASALSSD